ncbi:hypothetical protein [Anabaena sp. CCY 0017]|uniref:hypothetical protein n=1 Tax=Anabaena sp. CCY 0017 TaxID=3103866 RepID=UPI0039C5C055
MGILENKPYFLTSMPNYRRPEISGGTYLITQVTYQGQPWLCSDTGRTALRAAVNQKVCNQILWESVRA